MSAVGMRERFVATASEMLETDASAALVLADLDGVVVPDRVEAVFRAGGQAPVPLGAVTTAMLGWHVVIGLGEALITALVVSSVVATPVSPGASTASSANRLLPRAAQAIAMANAITITGSGSPTATTTRARPPRPAGTASTAADSRSSSRPLSSSPA